MLKTTTAVRMIRVIFRIEYFVNMHNKINQSKPAEQEHPEAMLDLLAFLKATATGSACTNIFQEEAPHLVQEIIDSV